MYELLADAGAELFALVMYGLGTVVLSLVGLVALGLAVDLAREEVLPALAEWRAS
jgi:hypothetical protein